MSADLKKKAAHEAARALVIATAKPGRAYDANLGEAHKAITLAARELEYERRSGSDRDDHLLLLAAAIRPSKPSDRAALEKVARMATRSDTAAKALLRKLQRMLKAKDFSLEGWARLWASASARKLSLANKRKVEVTIARDDDQGFSIKARQKSTPRRDLSQRLRQKLKP